MNAKYCHYEGGGLERVGHDILPWSEKSLIKDKDKTCLQTRRFFFVFFFSFGLETYAHKIKAPSHSELLSGCGLMILFCDQKEKSLLLDKMCVL